MVIERSDWIERTRTNRAFDCPAVMEKSPPRFLPPLPVLQVFENSHAISFLRSRAAEKFTRNCHDSSRLRLALALNRMAAPTQPLAIGGLIGEVGASRQGDEVVGLIAVLGCSATTGAGGMLGEDEGPPEQVFAAGVATLEGLGAGADVPGFPPGVQRAGLGVRAVEHGTARTGSSRHYN
jgi:hypothetical protein